MGVWVILRRELAVTFLRDLLHLGARQFGRNRIAEFVVDPVKVSTPSALAMRKLVVRFSSLWPTSTVTRRPVLS